ncbi:FeS assembly SUF system protein [Kordiimonas lacus]|uniref:FeS assembly SUF system protein n=2 Tax=Kordiimonas lacus TaxID=637679 RepID=A0A1G6T0U1_9PROT|nr:SUF system Fe-S cluster assembly protein [Kordiimonas lacus]SDD22770.1 FeS assembly SUF system protein [Kordiimonas lacus]
MMDTDNKRDIMDLSGSPEVPQENQPKADVERPTVSPQEGGYFLNKFLEQDKKEDAASEDAAPKNGGTPPASKDELEARIVEALREIYDPEIPVNIYEMGLIYGVDIDDDWNVKITMTLTTPHCPVAESMPGEVELKVNGVAGVNGTEVSLVWEPAWDMSNMSDEARLELGLL